jgi:hypothetical protein
MFRLLHPDKAPTCVIAAVPSAQNVLSARRSDRAGFAIASLKRLRFFCGEARDRGSAWMEGGEWLAVLGGGGPRQAWERGVPHLVSYKRVPLGAL